MPTADFEARVERVAEAIQESDDIHDRNKELLREYQRDKVLGGLSDAAISKNLTKMKQVALRADLPFDEMCESDMKELVEWLHSQDYTDETIDTYKNVIKAFWMWMDGDGETHPEAVKWIDTSGKSSNGTLPKDLLTKDDIERQVGAAKNPRDRAFIWMLYETGARIGELIDLTVGDVEDRPKGKKVVIDGKTGARRLPLVESVPHINKWLNAHPNPEKDAPLWCKIQQGGPDDQLGYRYIRDKVLAKNMDRAEIDKPSNPHHYRHSRASFLANHMTEAQLCEWFGWVQGSDVPAKYVHLSGRDLDNAYDAMHGLRDPEEDTEEPSVRECWRCETLNEPDRKYCGDCGAPLDSPTIYQAEQVQEDSEDLVIEVENEAEAKLLRAMQREIRQKPEEYLAE